MTEVRAKKVGTRWEGQFRFGSYWFPVKKRGRVVHYASAEAARAAATEAAPKRQSAA